MYISNRKTCAILFLLVFSNQSAFSEVTPPCSTREILQQNKHFFPQDKEIVKVTEGNGGYIINPFFEKPQNVNAEGIRVVESQSSNRQKLLGDLPGITEVEALRVINEISEILIKEISGSKTENQLNASQKLIINRINSFSYSFTDRGLAEASHSTSNLTIRIKNSALKSPRLAFVSLMAHEMGHALDLCHLSAHLLEKTIPAIDTSSLPDDKSLQELCTRGLGLDAQVRKDPSSELALKALLQNGSFKTIDHGIALSQNPTLPVYTCLAENNQTRALYPTLDQTQVCQKSNYTETSAQIWAARIVSNYIQLHPPASKLEALGLFALSLPSFTKDTPGNKESDMDQIYLGQAAIQDMFNCKPQRASCMSQFQPSDLL